MIAEEKHSVVSYALKVLFLFYQIPVSMTLCIFGRKKMFKFWILEMIYWITICFVAYISRKNKIHVKMAGFCRIPVKYIRIILLCVLGIGMILSIKRLGDFNISLSLSGVYNYRQYYKENSTDLMTFFKSAVGNYFAPCMITYYVYKRKPIPSIFFMFVQIVFFSLARDKTYYFLFPIAFLIGLFGNIIVEKFDAFMSFSYIVISAFSLLAAFNVYRTFIFELVIRRIFVVPSFLNYIYFYYFDSSKPIWWRQDTFLIDKLFTPVYDKPVTLVIANQMLNGRESNPNAGMFAEAYSRCGLLGIIIYPILIVFVLQIIDRCFKDAPDIAKIVLGSCLAVSVGNDVITSTSFVCTIVILLLGSTYFWSQKSKRSIT